MFELSFNTDHEDFRNNGPAEIIAVLKEIQESILSGKADGIIRDNDGHVIGRFSFNIPTA